MTLIVIKLPLFEVPIGPNFSIFIPKLTEEYLMTILPHIDHCTILWIYWKSSYQSVISGILSWLKNYSSWYNIANHENILPTTSFFFVSASPKTFFNFFIHDLQDQNPHNCLFKFIHCDYFKVFLNQFTLFHSQNTFPNSRNQSIYPQIISENFPFKLSE